MRAHLLLWLALVAAPAASARADDVEDTARCLVAENVTGEDWPTKRQARIRALPAAGSPGRLLRAYQRALVAARRGGPGTCTANHWGDRGRDFARATRLGWTSVVCGETRNAFWLRRKS